MTMGSIMQKLDRMGIPDHFVEHGSVKQLWEEIGLTIEEIIQKMNKMARKKQKRA